jgi:predicted ArsR family transcriptional regulator
MPDSADPPDGATPFEAAVHGIAVLDQPVRRAVYGALHDRRRWTGRDDVAARLGLPRSVAAFHLDKLAEAGLLDVRYERPGGRGGPGAGRPAKLYRRAAGELNASVPARHYELAAKLLARAIDEAARSERATTDVLDEVARRAGRDAGAASRAARAAHDRGTADDVVETLAEKGYEPVVEGDDVVLTNCPFHLIADEQRALVCGMNLEFVNGVLDGFDASSLAARLDYEPGYCCVRLGPRRASKH